MGLNPLKDRSELRQRIGYMPQGPALYEDLSARGNVAFFGAAHRTENLNKRVDEVLQFTDLSERANNAVHTFSGGMKGRVSLACTLVHDPEVIFWTSRRPRWTRSSGAGFGRPSGSSPRVGRRCSSAPT